MVVIKKIEIPYMKLVIHLTNITSSERENDREIHLKIKKEQPALTNCSIQTNQQYGSL